MRKAAGSPLVSGNSSESRRKRNCQVDLDFNLKSSVVFVDDEPNVLNSLRRLFRGKAWKQIFAASAEEALTLLEKVNGADVVVTDQRMPHMCGADLLRIVRRSYPWCARIVLSGYTDLPSVLEIINDGSAQRFLSKPWEDKVLLDVVAEAVESVEIRKQNEYFRAIVDSKNIDMKVTDYFEEKAKQTDVRQSRRNKIAAQSLEAAAFGVAAVSESEIIELVNEKACKILGVNENQKLEGSLLTPEIKLMLTEKMLCEPKLVSSSAWRGMVYTLSRQK